MNLVGFMSDSGYAVLFYQLAYGQAQGSAYRRLQGIGGHVDDGSCTHEEDRFVYIVQQGDQQTGASCQQQPG